MEEHGLVARRVFAEVPARVEYSATELGLDLEPVLLALCQWGQRHAEARNEAGEIADCIVRPRGTDAIAAWTLSDQTLPALTSSTRLAAETIASSDAATMLVLTPAPKSLPPG